MAKLCKLMKTPTPEREGGEALAPVTVARFARARINIVLLNWYANKSVEVVVALSLPLSLPGVFAMLNNMFGHKNATHTHCRPVGVQ